VAVIASPANVLARLLNPAVSCLSTRLPPPASKPAVWLSCAARDDLRSSASSSRSDRRFAYATDSGVLLRGSTANNGPLAQGTNSERPERQ
jgi:hypothetical protein